MKTRTFLFTAALASVLAGATGCAATSSDGPTATGTRYINLSTGETREYAEGQTVPGGWDVCSSNNECPVPLPCSEVDTNSCAVRTDCAVAYATGCDPTNYETGCVAGGCAIVEPVQCKPDLCAVPAIAMICSDGSVATAACEVGANGQCTYAFHCDDACAAADCGPMPAIAQICPDGSTATTVCERKSNGTCGYTFKCAPAPGPCADQDCGPMPQYAPLCPDGSTGQGVCQRNSAGTCSWGFDCSSVIQCKPSDCGPAPAIARICDDGTTADMVCKSNGKACGWDFVCPG